MHQLGGTVHAKPHTRIKCTIVAALLVLLSHLTSCPTQAKPFRYSPTEPHYDNVLSAHFAPDGRRTLSVDDSGVLIEWDFINKRIVRRVEAQFPTIRATLSDDAVTAVFLGKDGEVASYDLAGGKFRELRPAQIKKDEENDGAWGCLAVSPDGKAIFVSDKDGRLFRSFDGKPFAQFHLPGTVTGTKRFISALAVSPDGKKLALGEQGMLRIVGTLTGETIRLIPHDSISYSISLSFSPDSMLITAGIPGMITLNHSQQEMAIWEVDTGKTRLAISSPDGVASAGGFSRDGRLAVFAFSDSAQLYDMATGEKVGRNFKAKDKSELYFQTEFSPDGKYILISGRNGLLKIFESARIMVDKEPEEYAGLESRVSKVRALTFSQDASVLVVSHDEARPQVLDLKEHKMRERLDFHYAVDRFHFSKEGTKLLAIGPYALGQWQWPSLTKLPELEFKTENRVSDAVISPDGTNGVAITNNELIGNGFYRLPVVQAVDLRSGTVNGVFKLDNLKHSYARWFDLACVDFTAGTAVLLDNDGSRQTMDGRSPNFGRLSNRALLYSLADGKLLKTISSDNSSDEKHNCFFDKSGSLDCRANKDVKFDCIAMQFTGEERHVQPELENLHHYAYVESDRLSVVSEDGHVTATDKKDGSTRTFATSGTNFTSWETSNHVITMALSADGSTLAVGTNRGDVGFYDVRKEQWLGTYLYLGYGEWVWYTDNGIMNASQGGKDLVVRGEDR